MRYFFVLFSCILTLLGCSKNDKNTLRIGVTNGPHAVIAEFVQQKATTEGLAITLIPFDDFVQPNLALEGGDLDVNIYQHEPFLKDQIASRGFKFVSVGKAILLPLGIYGNASVKTLQDMKKEATVLIPSDPSNGGRALKLLEKAKLLKLAQKDQPTLKDIEENPYGLKMVEVEAPLLPRLLKDDADLAVINADWVMVSGMDPSKALLKEETHSPYANLIVVKEGMEKDPRMESLVRLYQSDDVKAFIHKTFKGAIVPAW